MLDRIDAEANFLLLHELKEWNILTYQQVRFIPTSYGFTSEYLCISGLNTYMEDFVFSTKIPIMLQLAELDLQKETTIAELVFSCCQYYPKKEAIEKLVELGKQKRNEKEVVRSLFEFRNNEDFNCLIVLFGTANIYRIKTGSFIDGPVLFDIENSCKYLIELAKTYELDLEKILNQVTKDAVTLFQLASTYSEEITEYLLKEAVAVNTVDILFMTPLFRVSLKAS